MVELLVIVAIIAILASLLMPALNRSVEQGRSVSCLNNLRQLQTGWGMYADENENELTPNNFVNSFVGSGSGSSVALPSVNSSWCPDSARTDTTTANIERGLLYPLVKSTLIYRCPSDKSTIEDVDGRPLHQLRKRSYNMSSSISCNVAPDYLPTFKKSTEIVNPRPERLFVFIDEHEDIMMDAHFGLCPPNAPNGYGQMWVDMPSDRHNQGANLSFADGHVEYWRWAIPKVAQSTPQKATNARDLKDLRRLQSVMKPFSN